MRLTNTKRELIVERLLRHRHTETVQELRLESRQFAHRVYNDVYPEKTLQRMEALPEGWLPVKEYMCVQFGGAEGFVRLLFNGDSLGKHTRARYILKIEHADDEHRRVLNHHSGCCAKIYSVDHELTKAFNELERKAERLNGLINDDAAAAHTILARCTTVNRVLTLWPEAEPFLKDMLKESLSLPAVATEELNQRFNLPVEELVEESA